MGFTDHEIAIARTAIALSLTGLVENTATAITELTAIDLERSRRGDATGAKIGSTLSRLGRALAHRFNEAVHAGGGNRLTVLPMASSRRADDLNAVLALGDDDDELQAELAAADTGTQETEDAS